MSAHDRAERRFAGTRLLRVRPLAMLAATLLTAAATPALAVTVAPIDTVRVHVTAEITERCGFAEGLVQPATIYSLDQATALDLDFSLDCNTPFAIGVKSENGGLAFDGAAPANGFAWLKPYTVGLSVNTDLGPLAPADCAAADLTAPGPCSFYGATPGEGLSSGEAISVGDPAHLKINWDAGQPGPRLGAGGFKDTITVVVGPAI